MPADVGAAQRGRVLALDAPRGAGPGRDKDRQFAGRGDRHATDLPTRHAIALCSALGVVVGALLQGDQDALRALGVDQTDEQAAQVWADVLGEQGLNALSAELRDSRLPVSAAGRAIAVLRAAGRL